MASVGSMIQEASRLDKLLVRCDNLYKELTKRTGANPKIHDMLAEYRQWFDEHGIESEGKDGWPLPFVFEERNILAFVNDWKLCMNPSNQPLQSDSVTATKETVRWK